MIIFLLFIFLWLLFRNFFHILFMFFFIFLELYLLRTFFTLWVALLTQLNIKKELGFVIHLFSILYFFHFNYRTLWGFLDRCLNCFFFIIVFFILRLFFYFILLTTFFMNLIALIRFYFYQFSRTCFITILRRTILRFVRWFWYWDDRWSIIWIFYFSWYFFIQSVKIQFFVFVHFYEFWFYYYR